MDEQFESDLELAKKALMYSICYDIVKLSATGLANVQTTDKTQRSMIAYDEFTKTIKNKKD